MDNPKQSNRGKFMRSKHKKEAHKKPKNYGSEDRTVRSNKPKDNGNLERQDLNQSTSAVKTKTATENSQVEEPQKVDFSHLKRETEEINDFNKKYQRRAIVSNWTKDYNIPENNDTDDEDGFDFKELLTGSSSYYVGSHFLMKEEQEWLKHSESCDSPFSIDLKNLEAGISSIPFYKRHDLLEKSFSPKEIKNMNEVAENNELLYKDMKIAKSKTQKIQLSSRDKETEIANKIMGIVTNTNIENKNSQCDISNSINYDTSVEKDEQKTSRDICVKNYDDSDIILNHEIDLTLPKSNAGNDKNIVSVTTPASLEQRKQNPVSLKQRKPVKNLNTADKNQFEISNGNDSTNKSEETEELMVDSIKTKNSLSNIKDFNNSEHTLSNEIENFQIDSVKTIKINETADKKILVNNKTEVKILKKENVDNVTSVKNDSLYKSNIIEDTFIENTVKSKVPEVEIKESLKVSEKKQPSNIDDELDFLLGLKQPTIAVDSNNASNLTILQEKLKDTHTDKKQIDKSVVKQRSVNTADEDLDEWLNSVLES